MAQTLPLLGEGGEHIVHDLDDRVLKTPKGDSAAILAWVQTNRALFPILQQHLGKFFAETTYYESLPNDEGLPEEFEGQPGVIQEKIAGKALAVIDDAEFDDPGFLQELIECMEAVLKLREETRELLVDWLGSKPEDSRHNRLNPLCSSNVLVTDEKKIKIIDTNPINDRIVPAQDGFQRAKIADTLLSIGWFMQNNTLRNYLNYVVCVGKLKAARLAYNAYYSTVFKLALRRFKRRLRKLEAA